jgi:hypothetical protein
LTSADARLGEARDCGATGCSPLPPTKLTTILEKR